MDASPDKLKMDDIPDYQTIHSDTAGVISETISNMDEVCSGNICEDNDNVPQVSKGEVGSLVNASINQDKSSPEGDEIKQLPDTNSSLDKVPIKDEKAQSVKAETSSIASFESSGSDDVKTEDSCCWTHILAQLTDTSPLLMPIKTSTRVKVTIESLYQNFSSSNFIFLLN